MTRLLTIEVDYDADDEILRVTYANATRRDVGMAITNPREPVDGRTPCELALSFDAPGRVRRSMARMVCLHALRYLERPAPRSLCRDQRCASCRAQEGK